MPKLISENTQFFSIISSLQTFLTEMPLHNTLRVHVYVINGRGIKKIKNLVLNLCVASNLNFSSGYLLSQKYKMYYFSLALKER